MSEKKRPNGGGGDSYHKRKYQKKGLTPASSVRGYPSILISCDRFKQREALKEICNLLDEYLECEQSTTNDVSEVDSSVVNDTTPSSSENVTMSVQDMLKQEMSTLKDERENESTSRKYSPHETGCHGVLLMRLDRSLCPVKIVRDTFEEVLRVGQRKTRYIERMIPLVNTCHASAEQFTEMSKPIIEKYLSASTEKIKYTIDIKRRNNNNLLRTDILPALTGIISDIETKHEVDHKNPSKVIMVQVFKNVCGLCVADDFERFNKFRLGSLKVGPKTKETTKAEGDVTSSNPGGKVLSKPVEEDGTAVETPIELAAGDQAVENLSTHSA